MAGSQIDRNREQRQSGVAPGRQLLTDFLQHPVAQFDDKIAGLRQRNELSGRHQPPQWMTPAHQGFSADDLAVAQVNFGLVMGA
jgi:hypothetical protein